MRVLLVEDDPLLGDGLEAGLRQSGFNVDWMKDGAAARAAMAVAWGDSWTNMVQPFWALPILGIAGLRARDIMGFCTLHLVLSGIIISIGLTFI